MPKLLYINDALAITGGLERVLTDKVNWLSKQKGYKVSVLTVNQGSHPLAFPLSDDVSYQDLDVQFQIQYQFSGIRKMTVAHRLHRLFRTRLVEKMNEIAPDIIICTRLDFLRDIIKIKGDIPLVFESHSSRLSWRYDGSGWLRKLQVQWMQCPVRKVQMTVALTNGDAEEWRKLTHKVCVIPNAVHLNESGSYSDCQLKTAIFVGRLCMQKDVFSLLRLWKNIHDQHPDWQLNIFGDGELKEDIHSEIDRMDSNVHVYPPTSNIMDQYKESSMLLMTSRFEPFGLVLPEAMSCGLPVIAFDCPYGPADIITDSVDGYLIKDRKEDVFSQRVCQLIESHELRVQMGQNGMASSQRYNASCIMPQWIQLFEQLTSCNE